LRAKQFTESAQTEREKGFVSGLNMQKGERRGKRRRKVRRNNRTKKKDGMMGHRGVLNGVSPLLAGGGGDIVGMREGA